MLLTIEQVAERLQVSTQTVRRLIKDGKLKAVRVGIQIRVREEDLQRFLSSS